MGRTAAQILLQEDLLHDPIDGGTNGVFRALHIGNTCFRYEGSSLGLFVGS